MKTLSTRHKYFVLAIYVLLSFGCASSSINKATTPTVSLDTFQSLSINIDGNKAAASENEINVFKTTLLSKLQEFGRWKTLENGELKVMISITDLKRVSDNDRRMLGALAGAASASADVTLSDNKGTTISRFSVEGSSSSHSIFSGGTDQALEKAAEQIGEHISSTHNTKIAASSTNE